MKGRVQRGNILLKQGLLDNSAEDFRFALKHQHAHEESQQNLLKINSIRSVIEQANNYYANGDFSNAETLLDKAIEHCQWDAELHKKRAKCRLARNDVQNSIADMRVIARLIPDSTGAYLEMAQMYYQIGDVENSLRYSFN